MPKKPSAAFTQPPLRMAANQTPSGVSAPPPAPVGPVASAFHEVTTNPPKIVAQTRKKKGAGPARKQTVAIALSKARAAGAKIQRRPMGSGRVTDADLKRGYISLGSQGLGQDNPWKETRD